MTDFNKAAESFNTIIDFLRYGLSQANADNLYYGHGTDNAWDDLLALILGSLNLPLELNPLLLQGRLTAEEKKHLSHQLSRRIIGKVPVPYLTQQAFFCGLPFYVDERVLIPRSPIAELIRQEFSPWLKADEVTHILDLCTGSACIAIACHYAFPSAKIDASDISKDALEVAQINCDRHGLGKEVRLIQSNCFRQIQKRKYDLIISNPPYVGKQEMRSLPPEYLHEPRMALESKDNGLGIVKEILSQAGNFLSEKGILVVEVGNSEEALIKAFPEMPFTWIEFEQGGQGVFLLSADQLQQYQASHA